MKGDVKYGFFVGLGVILAVILWHLLGRGFGGIAAGAAV
jgi:hypothetical protein